jgi:hypothetical protein
MGIAIRENGARPLEEPLSVKIRGTVGVLRYMHRAWHFEMASQNGVRTLMNANNPEVVFSNVERHIKISSFAAVGIELIFAPLPERDGDPMLPAGRDQFVHPVRLNPPSVPA